jgi:MFS family permease
MTHTLSSATLAGAGASATARADVRRVLWSRALRAFGDGYVAILLPVHLSGLGFGPVAVGAISTATLLGSALLTLGLGLLAHRVRRRPALLAASLLMTATGAGFALVDGFWPLALIAFVGTLNPSSGDVSLFLPLEHTILARSAPDLERTSTFARYSFVGIGRRSRRRARRRGGRLALATCRPRDRHRRPVPRLRRARPR